MKKKEEEPKGNIYDQLVKSHINIILNQVLNKHLNRKVKLHQKLTDKMQQSREREMDYAAIFETEDAEKFILHLELQSDNDPKMLDRMAEYHSLMNLKYHLPIIHYVVYLGRAKFNMPTKLPKELQFEGFHVYNYQDYDASHFLKSEHPEEVMQAILSKYKNPDEMLDKIIQRIFKLSQHKNEQVRYFNQLRIYTKLRKLDNLLSQKIETMPITFDENLEEDIYYQKGKVKGKIEGKQEHKEEVIIALLNEGLETDFIAKVVQVPSSLVEKLKLEKNA